MEGLFNPRLVQDKQQRMLHLEILESQAPGKNFSRRKST